MEKLTEITECCICADTYVDPRILPCIHTFCLKCLQETANSRSVGPAGTMSCPFCRKDFNVPKEGMIGLQKNFFMDRLVEITKISKPPEEAILCEICSNDSESKGTEAPRASQYCIQCHQHICDFCSQYHRKLKEYKEHQIVTLGHKVEEESIRKCATQFCDKHNKKQVEMYCADCKDVICMMCFAENHQGHKCSDIEKSAESFRNQIIVAARKVNGFSKDVDAQKMKIMEEESDFLKEVEGSESAILRRGKALKELIDKSMQSLLDDLKLVKQSWLKTAESEKERKDMYKGIIGSFENYCSELKAKGSAKEICLSVVHINSRVSELQQLHERQRQMNIAPLEISFEASKFEVPLKDENIVGKLNHRSVVEMMIPSSSTQEELDKRQIGFLKWRMLRGESGQSNARPALHSTIMPTKKELKGNSIQLKYSCAKDWYIRGDERTAEWVSLVFEVKNMKRKVEYDWNMVYLARVEGSPDAFISWKFDLSSCGKSVDTCEIEVHSACFATGQILWELSDNNGKTLKIASEKRHTLTEFRDSKVLLLKATLTRGSGDMAWQHTQLFRQKRLPEAGKDLEWPLNLIISLH